ncbi:hypothetical protein GCK32_020141, partial [Trichostrongylus colubriformis]
ESSNKALLQGGSKSSRRRRAPKKSARLKVDDPADVITQDVSDESSRKKYKKDGTNADKKITPTEGTTPSVMGKVQPKVHRTQTDDDKGPTANADDNRYIWAQNLMRTTSMASIRKEFIQNKNYRPPEYTFDYFKRNVQKNR